MLCYNVLTSRTEYSVTWDDKQCHQDICKTQADKKDVHVAPPQFLV